MAADVFDTGLWQSMSWANSGPGCVAALILLHVPKVQMLKMHAVYDELNHAHGNLASLVETVRDIVFRGNRLADPWTRTIKSKRCPEQKYPEPVVPDGHGASCELLRLFSLGTFSTDNMLYPSSRCIVSSRTKLEVDSELKHRCNDLALHYFLQTYNRNSPSLGLDHAGIDLV